MANLCTRKNIALIAHCFDGSGTSDGNHSIFSPGIFWKALARRWEVLGDTGSSHPDHWDDEWKGRVDLWGVHQCDLS